MSHFASTTRPLRRVVILAEGPARELEKARSLRRKAHHDATGEALLLRGLPLVAVVVRLVPDFRFSLR